jgi:glutamate N-acetyltransferase / amino-acid N-acetyltransferase
MDHRLPTGFRFAGIHCGIKPAKPDLALIVTDKPSCAFGVYTQNLVRAACIDWNRSITPSRILRAIVINSGNANACTGESGRRDNQEMAELVAKELGNADAKQVAVLSTGVIGQALPMAKLRTGIPQAVRELASDQRAFERASKSILTTDKGSKTEFRTFNAGGRSFSLAAMGKGAGMIGPNMATMLGFIVTDFPVPFDNGQSILKQAVDLSFNRISVEGHTSTNDGVILLAPNQATKGEPSLEAVKEFQATLIDLCCSVAKKIPTDGEGASHLIHIKITGATNDADADRIARTIALSNLVKTAVSGADPNWGRIVSAAGYAGVSMDVSRTSLSINGLQVFDHGTPTKFNSREVSESIRHNFNTEIDLCVGSGSGTAEHWTSDLTADYVKLNAEYTT